MKRFLKVGQYQPLKPVYLRCKWVLLYGNLDKWKTRKPSVAHYYEGLLRHQDNVPVSALNLKPQEALKGCEGYNRCQDIHQQVTWACKDAALAQLFQQNAACHPRG